MFQNEYDQFDYIEKNIRFLLINSSTDIIELDTVNGNLNVAAGRCLDREWLVKQACETISVNLTVYDQRKLFKAFYLNLNLKITDLNDNAPQFKQKEYNIRLNRKNAPNEMVVFDEMAVDLDAGENSALTYKILTAFSFSSVRGRISATSLFYFDNNRLLTSRKIFERKERFYTVQLVCSDNGYPIKFSTVTLNIFVETNRHGLTKYFEFNLNLESFQTTEPTRLGSVPLQFIRPLMETIKFNSSNKIFDLCLNSDSSLMISVESAAQLTNVDTFSYVRFELELAYEKIVVIVRFSPIAKYKFSQQFYEFNLTERNKISLIANLDTNCENLNSKQIEIITENNHMFQVRTNKSEIALISVGELDYEYQAFHVIQLNALCNQNYLITAEIRINLIDLNDNKPIFLNPHVSNQTFYVNFKPNRLFITRIEAIDTDKTEKFSAIKYKLTNKQDDLFFEINESTGDLYLRGNLIPENKISFNLKLIAFNDDADFYSNTIDLNLVLLKPIVSEIELTNSISKVSLVKSNLEFLVSYTRINKCWLAKDFTLNLDTKHYSLSIHDTEISLLKRNGYFNSSLIVECELTGQDERLNFLSWHIYFVKPLLPELMKTKQVHFKVDRYDLLGSEKIVKIDQLFDLNISFEYFIVYSLKFENEIDNLLTVNRFNGELSKKKDSMSKVNKIILDSDLIKVSLEVSYFMNRHQQNAIFPVFIHIVNTSDESIFRLISQLENTRADLDNRFIKIEIKNIIEQPSIHLSNSSDIKFSINKVMQFGLENENETEINNDLFSIQFQTNLNIEPKKLSSNEVRYFRILLDLCPLMSRNKKIFKCTQISLNVQVEINLKIEQANFLSEKFEFDYEWSKVSANVALIDLKTLIKDSQFHKLDQAQFDIDSDLFVLNELLGLVYFKPFSFIRLASFNVSLVEISTHRIIAKAKVYFNFLNLKSNVIDLAVQLEDSESNRNDLINLIKLNTTKEDLDLICLSLDQFNCKNLFSFNGPNLILNHQEARKQSVDQIKILIKQDKYELAYFNVNLSIESQTQDIQFKTFQFSQRIVNLIESTEKKAVFWLNTDKSSYLQLIRVKNIITNNEVLALDYEFKRAPNSSQYFLKLDDAMSLELNQIYSFDFRISNFQSSLYMVRLKSLDSIVNTKQFISFYCDFSVQEQLILNLSKLDENDEKTLFTQKIYLLSSYTKLNIEHFQIRQDKLYLIANCRQVISSEASLSIMKFYIDKISLRVKKIIEIKLSIEILSQTNVHLKNYHQLIKKTKSSLLIDDELSESVIYEFNLPNYEFSIDYDSCNDSIPFEINQFTGRLAYLIGEDNSNFDKDGEKYFKFNVLIASANTVSAFNIEFLLIDDDPIVLINENSLTTRFTVDNIGNELIGQIDFASMIKSESLKNMFISKQQSLNFRIQDKSSMFHLDESTGLLYLKNSFELKSQIHSLNVRVNGTVGSRVILVHVNVLIFISKELHFNISKLKLKEKYDFYMNNSLKQSVQEFQFYSNNDPELVTRFKVLNQQDPEQFCQINWLTGIIYCSTNESNKKTSLSVLLIHKTNNGKLKFVNFVKVRLF